MKKAGFPTGKYNGPPLLMVTGDKPPESNTAQAVRSELSQLGIRLTLREVPEVTVLTKYCGVPRAAVAICSDSWSRDFLDAESLIVPVFYGHSITFSVNTNWSQVNDPTLNKEMEAASQLTDPSARATAWANLDRQITSQVYVVTWLWGNEVGFHSTNVVGVQWRFNGNDWDLAASSLK